MLLPLELFVLQAALESLVLLAAAVLFVLAQSCLCCWLALQAAQLPAGSLILQVVQGVSKWLG